MELEPAPSISLSLPSLIHLTWREWRTNQVCRLVWKRIRPAVLATALVEALLWTAGVGAGGHLIMGVQACVLAAAVALIWGPQAYASWAYRTWHLADPMLRLTRLSRRDRLMGLLAPVVVAIAIWFAVALPFLLLLVVSPGGIPRFPTPHAVIVTGLEILALFTTLSAGAVWTSLLFATQAFRWMILGADIVPGEALEPGYSKGPASALALCGYGYLTCLLANQLPPGLGVRQLGVLLVPAVVTIVFLRFWKEASGSSDRRERLHLFAPLVAFGAYAVFCITVQDQLLATYAGARATELKALSRIVLGLLFAFGTTAAMRPFWRTDIRLARRCLFGAGDTVA